MSLAFLAIGLLTLTGSTFAVLRFDDESWFSLLLIYCVAYAARFGARRGLALALLGVLHAVVISTTRTPISGSPEVFFVSAVWIGVCVTVGRLRDLNVRTRSLGAQVKQRERQYESLLNTIPDVVVSIDLDGVITYCTDRHAALLGYQTAAEVIGRSAFSFMEQTETERAMENMDRIRNNEIVRTDYRLVHADGSPITAEVSAAPVAATDGAPRGAVGIVRDVTIERQNARKVRQLLDEKTRLLAEVKHRAKNHMQTIAMFIRLKLLSGQNDETVRALEDTLNRLAVMQRLYEQVFESTDSDETTAAAPYLREIIALLQESFSGVVDATIETNIAEFESDPQTLLNAGIIVNELATNSLKYAFSGVDRPAVIQIEISAPEDRTVAIAVRDNGRGFPDSVVKDRELGFGLRIVEEQTKNNNGEMVLYNDTTGAVVRATIIGD